MITTLKEAIHSMLENSKIPPRTLAEALAISYSGLMNAANPNLPEFRFQARHLIPLTHLLGDFTAIDYIENSLGRVAFEVPRPTAETDIETLHSDLMVTIKDFGQLVSDASEALAPGHLKADEVKALERDAFNLMRDVMHFIDDVTKAYSLRHK